MDIERCRCFKVITEKSAVNRNRIVIDLIGRDMKIIRNGHEVIFMSDWFEVKLELRSIRSISAHAGCYLELLRNGRESHFRNLYRRRKIMLESIVHSIHLHIGHIHIIHLECHLFRKVDIRDIDEILERRKFFRHVK